MKKMLFLLLALLVLSGTALARNAMPIKPLCEIDLYGVNDFQGHITGSTATIWPVPTKMTNAWATPPS